MILSAHIVVRRGAIISEVGSALRRTRPATANAARRFCAAGLLVAGAGIVSLLLTDAAAGASLDAEVARLIESHPQIQAARKNIAAAEEGITRAFAGYLPTLSVTGDYGFENTDSPSLRSSRDGRSLDSPRESMTVSLSQNLFDGFSTTSRNETARITRSVAEIDLDTTLQNVLFEGVSAYLNVMRQTRLVELAVRSERTIQIQLSLEDERVSRGAGIAVDVLQAKSRLQIAKERRVAFSGNLRDAVTRYVQVFDATPENGSMILPTPPLDLLPRTLAEAETVALAENPAAANTSRSIDLADERRRTARSAYYPTVDLVGEYNFEQDEAGVAGTRRDYIVKVEASWELFSGFATRDSSAEAAQRYLATLDNHNFVTRKILENVRLSWEQLQTVRQRVTLLENAVNIAGEVHDARRKLREAGKETVINVLDAESEVFNAQINSTNANFDARIAIYRLIQSMGRLTPVNLDRAGLDDPLTTFAAWSVIRDDTPEPLPSMPAVARMSEPATPRIAPQVAAAPMPAPAEPAPASNFSRFWSFE